jgi:NADH-quinone oxidoreductase subunit E
MTHYIIEFALWTLLAYAIGCLIGYLLRTMFGVGAAEAPGVGAVTIPDTDAVQHVELHVPKIAEMDNAVPVAAAAAAEALPLRMDRPKGLDQARDGNPDDLQRISGIGPKNEKILHTLGFFHFDQIAAWTVEQVAWVDDHLKFNGRIGREEWIAQAKLLAAGRDDEFHALYGTGGKKNEDGVAEPGSRTRKT